MKLIQLSKEYKREGLNTYLVFEQEDKNKLELKMLSRNQPKSLLPIEVRNQNGAVYFYYNITNQKTLEKLIEKTPLSYHEIKLLFYSILDVIEMTREYLLEPDSLLLDEENIYKDSTYRFLYLPGRKNNIIEQMGDLITYLMDRIDQKDQEAVVYIYTLYRMTKEGTFDIESIRSFDEMEENSYYKILEEHKEESRELQQFFHEKEVQETEQCLEKEKEEERKRDIKFFIREKWKNYHFISWIPLGIFVVLLFYEGYYIYGRAASIEIQILCIITFFCFLIYLLGLYYWMKRKKEKRKVDLLFSGLSKEKQKLESSETTVLDEKDIECELAKLVPLNEREEDTIFIRKEGFVIGNMIGHADGKINQMGVSRMHAMIERKKDKFTIKDLKSTNGTTVNGILLKEGECVKLREGDEIQFGNCSYIFSSNMQAFI